MVPRPHRTVRASAVAAAIAALASPAVAEDDLEKRLEETCNMSRMYEVSGPEQQKIAACVQNVTTNYLREVQEKAGMAPQASACPLEDLQGIDDSKIAFRFVEALREKRPAEAHALLAPQLAAKAKPAETSKLIDPLLADLKGGLAALTELGMGSSNGSHLCRGATAIAHRVVELSSPAMSPRLLAFDIVAAGGEGRIADIYVKARSDVETLEGVPPFQVQRIRDTVASLAQALDTGDFVPFMRELSVERKFQFQSDVTGPNKLEAMFKPARGKLSYDAFEKLNLAPTFTKAPAAARLEEGYPTVDAEGTMATQPEAVSFKLKYVYDLGDWRLHDFKLDFTPLKGAAAATGAAATAAKAEPSKASAEKIRLSDPTVPHVITYQKADAGSGTVVRTVSGARVREAQRYPDQNGVPGLTRVSLTDVRANTGMVKSIIEGQPQQPAIAVKVQFLDLLRQTLRYHQAAASGSLTLAGETCTSYKLYPDIDQMLKDKVIKIATTDEIVKAMDEQIAALRDGSGVSPGPAAVSEDDLRSIRAGNPLYEACITSDGLILAIGDPVNGFDMTATKIERRAVTEKELALTP